MKKNFLLQATLAALLAASALTASGAGFTKSNTYTQGMFADVSSDKWYESSVSSALLTFFGNTA